MKVDLEVGDTLQSAEVIGRSRGEHFPQTVTMQPSSDTDRSHLKKEMQQIGWQLQKTRPSGVMIFEDADSSQ